MFIDDSLFSPRDYDKSKIPLITIRLMAAADMSSKDASVQATLLQSSTCKVTNGLGNRATEVLLKVSSQGSNYCLGYSANVATDSDSYDGYIYDTLLHEFLHVLGMAHEQKHPDAFQRDANGLPKLDSDKNFIYNKAFVNDDVIIPWNIGQYGFEKDTSLYQLERDPDSIMSYSKFSDTICEPTRTNTDSTKSPPVVTGSWDYKDIDPTDPKKFDAMFQTKLNTLDGTAPPVGTCARNLTWRSNSTCLTVCAVQPAATREAGSYDAPAGVRPAGRGLSTKDLAQLRRIYRFNWEDVKSRTTLTLDPSNDAMRPANVIGSLRTLVAEMLADSKSKLGNPSAVLIGDDPEKPHFFVKQLIAGKTVRGTSGSCVSGNTNIVDGRKSCTIPTRCIQVANKGNILVPTKTNYVVTERGESSCAVSYTADGSLCLTGKSRGTTANGSYGNVVCAVSAHEFSFSELQ